MQPHWCQIAALQFENHCHSKVLQLTVRLLPVPVHCESQYSNNILYFNLIFSEFLHRTMKVSWVKVKYETVINLSDYCLDFRAKQQNLEERQADVEYELRCLLNKPGMKQNKNFSFE